jgi:flagella basal body P-ring formation protein FlgA
VIYAEKRSFSIWARVRVSVNVTRTIAIEDLRQGTPILARQLRTETVDTFPPTRMIPRLDYIVGMLPVRPIAAGSEIRIENLTRPIDVARGALVHVEARNGSARVELIARAEAAGRIGDLIAVRNIESSRVFHARIDAPGSVLVEAVPVQER